MTQDEKQALFADIERFLHAAPCLQPDTTPASEYWRSHPTISEPEVRLLWTLSECGQCAHDVAERLRRDLDATTRLLEAFVAVGILERDGSRYSTTMATRAYLYALDHGCIESSEDPSET